jgi:hypothetical protein
MATTGSSGDDSRTVTGLFSDASDVERAYRSVVARGYDGADVNVLMSDATRQRVLEHEPQVSAELTKKSAEGGALGGPAGGRIGIAISIAAAVGAALVVPALGLVAAGPIAAALTGAGAAGLAAGLIGALGDWGVPEERVRRYEAAIRDGGILMAVRTRSAADARDIASAWQAAGARDVHG